MPKPKVWRQEEIEYLGRSQFLPHTRSWTHASYFRVTELCHGEQKNDLDAKRSKLLSNFFRPIADCVVSR